MLPSMREVQYLSIDLRALYLGKCCGLAVEYFFGVVTVAYLSNGVVLLAAKLAEFSIFGSRWLQLCRLRSDVSQMLCAPRGLPLAELEKHIDGATLDLGRIAASWEKEGKKVS